MQRFNAIDAIVPAFTRTHAVLSRPFRWGRSWKLAASVYLSWCGSVFIPVPLFFAFVPWHRIGDEPAGARILPVLVGMATLSTLLFVVLFYLGARMKLVNFEMMVTGAKILGPIWKRYGRRVWPTILAKVAIGTVLTGLVAPLLLRSTGRLILAYGDLLRATGSGAMAGGVAPSAIHEVIAALLPFYAIFLPYVLLLRLLSTLLEDFVLPIFLLEDVTLSTAIARAWRILQAEPLQVAGFLLMKLVYFFAGFMVVYGSYFVLLIPIALIFGVGAAVAAILFGATGGGSGVFAVLLVVAAVLLYLAVLVVLMWYLIGSLGYLLTVLDAHALYFLGGRYARLGDLLEPPSATSNFVYAPPPMPPSPEENSDDDGEPPMPMDPALA